MSPAIKAAGQAYEQALRRIDAEIADGALTPETARRLEEAYDAYLTARTSTAAEIRFDDGLGGAMKSEPVLTVSAVVAALGAIFGVLGAFGVGVSKDQQDAILDAIPVIFPVAVIIGGVVARGRVTPTAKAERKITEAFHATPGVDPKPAL